MRKLEQGNGKSGISRLLRTIEMGLWKKSLAKNWLRLPLNQRSCNMGCGGKVRQRRKAPLALGGNFAATRAFHVFFSCNVASTTGNRFLYMFLSSN